KSFGVQTQWVQQDPQFFTTLAFVSLLENGERDFYFSRGADGQLRIEEVNRIDLNKTTILHFGSATAFLPGPLQETYHYLLEKAVSQGKYISFDPNYRHLLFANHLDSFIGQSWTFLEQCNFFKVSDEEALQLTGKKSVSDAARYFRERTKSIFAITLGKEGTLLGLPSSMETVPSISVQPKDTTGAGDAFVGAVLYQLSVVDTVKRHQLTRDEWIKIIANGNKAGARTCEYLGAMEAFKHLSNEIFR
ncbi:MAG: carbohydrate kinase family protein, partial [Chitinophagaceae bacterium]